MHTVDEAKTKLCPIARTFAIQPAEPHCRGPECMFWRWVPVSTAHPLYTAAVQKKAAELDEKAPFKQAARYVADNLAELGLVPTQGYCGQAGQ